MKMSIKLVTLFGVPVFVHWSFSLLIIYILYSGFDNGLTPASVAWNVITILGLFACVVLHEFGHVLSARRYGVQTTDVILLPIGGVARLKSLPKKAIQELIVALAGPAVNLVIAFILSPYFLIYGTEGFMLGLSRYVNGFSSASTFIPIIIAMNIILVIFNLIPAFPMDGGRVLRALLSLKIDRVKATLWAVRIGQAISILLIYFGIFGANTSPFNILIGAFIFVMGQQEYNSVKSEKLIEASIVGDMYRNNFKILDGIAILGDLNIHHLSNQNHLVRDIDGSIKLLSTENLKKYSDNKHSNLSSISIDIPYQLEPSTSLKSAINIMRHGYPALPVYEDEILIGILDFQDINRFLKSA